MGFTSGFLGGIALTSSILYLSISIHKQNRFQQSALLRQQEGVLRNVLDPTPPLPPRTTREVRGGLVELSKDKWNRGIEAIIRTMNDTDWNQVRTGLEQKLETAAEQMTQTVKESVPSKETLVAPVQRREG